MKALWEKVSSFFVDLYKDFIHLSWVEATINFCKENWIWLAVGVGVLLIIAIICRCATRKKRKAKKAAKKAAKAEKKAAKAAKKAAKKAKKNDAPAVAPAAPAAQNAPVAKAQEAPKATPAPAEKADTPAAKQPAPVEAKKEAPVEKEIAPAAEMPVEAIAIEIPVAELHEEPAPVAEKKEAPKAANVPTEKAEAPAPKKEEETKQPAPAQAKAEPAPAVEKKEPAKSAKAKDVEETLAMVDDVDEDVPEQLRDNYEEDETDRIARYKGKWVICRVVTDEENSEEMYFFELRASNGEKLLSSEEYTTYQGALRGIQTHKTNIMKGNLKVTLSKKGDYIFKLLSGKNMLLCMGENYPTRARCESAIDSTIRFGTTAIIDENVQDIVIKVPKEDDTPLASLPENCNGKWIISSGESVEGEKIYYFELYANNGEKLLSSEEYTTYIGAVNGIQTHKRNVLQDNFRISLTKRGDYIYKLLNANGQLLCLGEHYKTKRLCQNAVESVKRFALNSPVLTSTDAE